MKCCMGSLVCSFVFFWRGKEIFFFCYDFLSLIVHYSDILLTYLLFLFPLAMHGDPEQLFIDALRKEAKKVQTVASIMREVALLPPTLPSPLPNSPFLPFLPSSLPLFPLSLSPPPPTENPCCGCPPIYVASYRYYRYS